MLKHQPYNPPAPAPTKCIRTVTGCVVSPDGKVLEEVPTWYWQDDAEWSDEATTYQMIRCRPGFVRQVALGSDTEHLVYTDVECNGMSSQIRFASIHEQIRLAVATEDAPSAPSPFVPPTFFGIEWGEYVVELARVSYQHTSYFFVRIYHRRIEDEIYQLDYYTPVDAAHVIRSDAALVDRIKQLKNQKDEKINTTTPSSDQSRHPGQRL